MCGEWRRLMKNKNCLNQTANLDMFNADVSSIDWETRLDEDGPE